MLHHGGTYARPGVRLRAPRRAVLAVDRFDGGRLRARARHRGAARHAPPYNASYVVYPLSAPDVQRVGMSPSAYRWARHHRVAAGPRAAVGPRDAPQVRRQTERLRVSERRYGHLFDAVADPVLVLECPAGRARAGGQPPRAARLRHQRRRPAPGRHAALLSPTRRRRRRGVLPPRRRRTASARRRPCSRSAARTTRVIPFELSTRHLDLDGDQRSSPWRATSPSGGTYELGLSQAMDTAETARAEAEAAGGTSSRAPSWPT